MMPKVLNIIRDEHRSISAVLHGMQYLVKEVRTRQARIDPRVFRAMLYYLDTFSERMHHPKEDRYLFSAMRKRGSEAEAIVEELEKEHAGRETKDFQQLFSRIANLAPPPIGVGPR